MQPEAKCPDCGAAWHDGITCLDHFHQMLAWEFEDPGGAGAVHHLTVLCYNLQHPRVYSPEGLDFGRMLLARFVVDGISPQHILAQHKQQLDAGRRSFRITGTPEAHGEYAFPVQWTITIADVCAGGLDGYCERVEAWARAVSEALSKSGNYSVS